MRLRSLIAIFAGVLILCACSQQHTESISQIATDIGSSESTWQEMFDLGMKYLTEENYVDARINV